MAEPRFTPSFLKRVVELEGIATPAELELLDQILARIVTDPFLPQRFPTFYDPDLPTFFARTGPFLIEFAADEETDSVTFIMLFYRG